MRRRIRRWIAKFAIVDRVFARSRPYLRWWQFDEFGTRFQIEPHVRINIQGALCIGDNVVIRRGCLLTGTGNLVIGTGSAVNANTIITAMESVRIGRDCMIAPNVYVLDVDHKFDTRAKPIKAQGYRTAPVVIEDNVWIGSGSLVLRGVTIGQGAIVAANSVVNRDVEPYAIVGGSPAKRIGVRP